MSNRNISTSAVVSGICRLPTTTLTAVVCGASASACSHALCRRLLPRAVCCGSRGGMPCVRPRRRTMRYSPGYFCALVVNMLSRAVFPTDGSPGLDGQDSSSRHAWLTHTPWPSLDALGARVGTPPLPRQAACAHAPTTATLHRIVTVSSVFLRPIAGAWRAPCWSPARTIRLPGAPGLRAVRMLQAPIAAAVELEQSWSRIGSPQTGHRFASGTGAAVRLTTTSPFLLTSPFARRGDVRLQAASQVQDSRTQAGARRRQQQRRALRAS